MKNTNRTNKKSKLKYCIVINYLFCRNSNNSVNTVKINQMMKSMKTILEEHELIQQKK